MPLPKPPARKAALLAPADFEAQAAPKPARRDNPQPPRSTEPEGGPAVLELFDSHAASAAPLRPVVAAAPARRPHGRAKGAQAARHRPGQAVRARHQRADARPDVPVPLRGARRLPADDHARGARRPQEGHERGLAQRAPGQPRARRAGRRRAACRRREGIALAKTGHREAGGKLFFQTTLLDVKLPDGLPQGKADNQILGVVISLRERAARAATSCWCPRTSTCASRRVRWAWPPRTTSTTRRSKTATCCTPASCRCRPTSGNATARRWRAGSRAATPSTASPARWCRR